MQRFGDVICCQSIKENPQPSSNTDFHGSTHYCNAPQNSRVWRWHCFCAPHCIAMWTDGKFRNLGVIGSTSLDTPFFQIVPFKALPLSCSSGCKWCAGPWSMQGLPVSNLLPCKGTSPSSHSPISSVLSLLFSLNNLHNLFIDFQLGLYTLQESLRQGDI